MKISAWHLFVLEVYFHIFEKFRLFSSLTRPYGLDGSLLRLFESPGEQSRLVSIFRLKIDFKIECSYDIEIYSALKILLNVIFRNVVYRIIYEQDSLNNE